MVQVELSNVVMYAWEAALPEHRTGLLCTNKSITIKHTFGISARRGDAANSAPVCVPTVIKMFAVDAVTSARRSDNFNRKPSLGRRTRRPKGL
jgi:hypothetical protein